MGFDDYVSENEAASLASVSVQTLRRFVEAGYLRGETDTDGLRLFSKSDVASLFGVSTRDLERKSNPIRMAPPAPTPEPMHVDPVATSQTDSLHQLVEVQISKDSTPVIEPIRTKTVATATQEEEKPVAPTDAGSFAEVLDAPATVVATKESIPDQATTIATHEHQIELIKLRSVVDLQEKLLVAREQDIAALRSERDWLRTRIEKLEDKQDRDQLILLTETQMIRRLVSHAEPKRSGFRAALEWLGIATPTTEPVQHDSVMGRERNS